MHVCPGPGIGMTQCEVVLGCTIQPFHVSTFWYSMICWFRTWRSGCQCVPISMKSHDSLSCFSTEQAIGLVCVWVHFVLVSDGSARFPSCQVFTEVLAQSQHTLLAVATRIGAWPEKSACGLLGRSV